MAKRSLALLVGLVMFVACGRLLAEEMEEIEPYVGQFSYAPSVNKAPGSAGVTFAVAKVDVIAGDVTPKGVWAGEIKAIEKSDPSGVYFYWYKFPQVSNMPTKLRRDIAETLFANGFGVKGPYESLDAIPPAAKKAIDLYLTPKVKLAFKVTDVRMPGTLTQKIVINGTIIMEIRYAASGELVATKEVPFSPIEVVSEMKTRFYTLTKYNGIMNEVVKEIERQYPKIMEGVTVALDPQEMRSLKRGAAGTGKTGY